MKDKRFVLITQQDGFCHYLFDFPFLQVMRKGHKEQQ